jgi:hypothetical protein
MWIELAREKHARGLQNLVRATQLRDLTTQGFDLLTLLARQHVLAPNLISFDLPRLFTKRLAVDAEITRNMHDRTTRLEDQTSATVQQLL